jgi:hypothetical protein
VLPLFLVTAPAAPRRPIGLRLQWGLAVGLALLAGSAVAQDAVRGRALFSNTNGAPSSCATSGCHDGFPTVRRNAIDNATSAFSTLNAIARNRGGMGVLTGFVSNQDAEDIAAYVANPDAAGAVASISPQTLSIAQTVATTSTAQIITLGNTGGATLTVSGVALSGAQASEYAIAGGTTCTNGASVAIGSSCVVRVTLTPAAAGARTATLTVTHNGRGGASTVALNGTGTTAAQPAVSLSRNAVTFATQAVSTTSAVQTVTVINSGQAALTLSGLALGGANAPDFMRSGTCNAGAAIPAGGNCAITLSFSPQGGGARSAALSLSSDAANGAQSVALSGTGALVTMSLMPTSASLQAQAGSTSTPAVETIRNTGSSTLTVSSVVFSGPFALAVGTNVGTNACAAAPFQLATGQECSLYIVFQPQGAGSMNGEVIVATNAPNSPARAGLSGQATAAPAGGAATATNQGLSGCSIGRSDQLFDPVLLGMLTIAVLVLALRRRRAGSI